MKTWVGVDLDGCLAEYHGDPLTIGKPVPKMMRRVKRLLKAGKEVRIFTARVYYGPERSGLASANCKWVRNQRRLIRDWTIKHVGKELKATCIKDFLMEYLYDDRARQVVFNTGELVGKRRGK